MPHKIIIIFAAVRIRNWHHFWKPKTKHTDICISLGHVRSNRSKHTFRPGKAHNTATDIDIIGAWRQTHTWKAQLYDMHIKKVSTNIKLVYVYLWSLMSISTYIGAIAKSLSKKSSVYRKLQPLTIFHTLYGRNTYDVVKRP